MKTNMNKLHRVVVTAAAVTLLAGCATGPSYKQAEKTGTDVDQFRAEVAKASQAVGASTATLDQLVQNADTNPHKGFEALSKAVGSVDDTAAKFKQRADDMREQGAAYFKQWDQQLGTLKNPEIRQLAVERRTKLQESFGRVSDLTQKARESLLPFVSDLHDVRTLLGSELTSSGINAAKDVIKKTEDEGTSVKSALAELTGELNTVAAKLTPGQPAPQSNQASGKGVGVMP